MRYLWIGSVAPRTTSDLRLALERVTALPSVRRITPHPYQFASLPRADRDRGRIIRRPGRRLRQATIPASWPSRSTSSATSAGGRVSRRETAGRGSALGREPAARTADAAASMSRAGVDRRHVAQSSAEGGIDRRGWPAGRPHPRHRWSQRDVDRFEVGVAAATSRISGDCTDRNGRLDSRSEQHRTRRARCAQSQAVTAIAWSSALRAPRRIPSKKSRTLSALLWRFMEKTAGVRGRRRRDQQRRPTPAPYSTHQFRHIKTWLHAA